MGKYFGATVYQSVWNKQSNISVIILLKYQQILFLTWKVVCWATEVQLMEKSKCVRLYVFWIEMMWTNIYCFSRNHPSEFCHPSSLPLQFHLTHRFATKPLLQSCLGTSPRSLNYPLCAYVCSVKLDNLN